MSYGDIATIVGVAFGIVLSLGSAGFAGAGWIVRSINQLGTRLEVGDQKFKDNDTDHLKFETKLDGHEHRITKLESAPCPHVRSAA